ncbi:MAG TPA: four helix bundle protein [Acidobacteriaceae bacterium]|jgi:four helix bundle protein
MAPASEVRHFRELIVWQRSMQLSVTVYELTRTYPREELYGLTSQMRRASVSILSNIAEGHGRHSRLQLTNFTSMAKGSCFELEAQLLLARELGYGELEHHQKAEGLCNEVGRMLHAMLAKLQRPVETPNASSGGEN